ncbi:hypothetical protein [Parabacteroides chinchillae]
MRQYPDDTSFLFRFTVINLPTFVFHKEWLTSGVPKVTTFGSVICKFSNLPVDSIRFAGHDSGWDFYIISPILQRKVTLSFCLLQVTVSVILAFL